MIARLARIGDRLKAQRRAECVGEPGARGWPCRVWNRALSLEEIAAMEPLQSAPEDDWLGPWKECSYCHEEMEGVPFEAYGLATYCSNECEVMDDD